MSPQPSRLREAAILALLVTTSVQSYRGYVSMSPNGASVPDPGSGGYVAAIGHTSHSGGGKRNSYGLDFARAQHTWSAALCIKDSDGDGFTNGGGASPWGVDGGQSDTRAPSGGLAASSARHSHACTFKTCTGTVLRPPSPELGDPCCVWRTGATPRWVDGLSMPGESASTPAPRAGCMDAVCENGVVPCSGRIVPASPSGSPLPPGTSPSTTPSAPPPSTTSSAAATPSVDDNEPASMPDVEVGAIAAGVGVLALAVGMATQWVRFRRRAAPLAGRDGDVALLDDAGGP